MQKENANEMQRRKRGGANLGERGGEVESRGLFRASRALAARKLLVIRTLCSSVITAAALSRGSGGSFSLSMQRREIQNPSRRGHPPKGNKE